MHNDTLAVVLGQALADSDDLTLAGIESVVGELALHIRSVSGPEHGEMFLAKVRSNALRIMESGVMPGCRVGGPRRVGGRSDVVATLTTIEDSMTGSTSPAL